MSGLRIIKYFKGPAFTADIWSARNPYLRSGEIGYLLSGGIVTGAKVGPGYWNDLGFIGEDVYPYIDPVTNKIGDVPTNIQGMKLIDILRSMLSPYQAPVISGVQNNAGGIFASTRTREIGQITNGPINIIYSVSNLQNLQGATPINITAGGVFSNEGNFANSGNISLSLTSPLNPVTPQIISILVKPIHQQGIGSGSTTVINYFPRILWFSSIDPNISSGSQLMGQSGIQSLVTSTFRRNYSFPGSGYSYVAIPAMLSPSNLVFTDVTDPNAPAGYDMISGGQFSINNGVGTYNYVIYRSQFLLIQPTILRIS
jgi:hypothetical protein